MRLKSRPEKALFVSLWGVLILGVALWNFWPSEPETYEDPLPTIILANELTSWFQTAAVTSATATTYTIEIQFQQKYVESLDGDKRKAHLAYHFMRETTVLSQGIAEVEIPPEGLIKLVLPNPNRVAARRIQLSLAH